MEPAERARVVFIEGLPGSGKSTAAQRLAWECEQQGLPARWYYESQPGHPLAGYFDPEACSVPEFLSGTVARWHAFAASAAPGLHLVESHLFQGPLGSLLLQDVESERITSLVRSLMQAMEPLTPRLIRLINPDPAGALERISLFRWGSSVDSPYTTRFTGSPYARIRGLQGFSGYLAFLTTCIALSDGICADSDWPILELQLSDLDSRGYAQRLQAMRRFIAIPEGAGPSPASAPAPEVRACIGTYRLPEGTICHVECDDQGLLVHGHPRLWMAGNRLLHRHGLQFLAVSWPFAMQFDSSADGTVTSLVLCSMSGEPVGARAVRSL